jgi:DNA-directed RNA polymerase omega subunit
VIQNLPDGVDSKFRMVILLARRAEQLMRGARPKMDTETPVKPTRLAAGEFEKNMIRWDFGPEGGSLPTESEEAPESVETEES